MRSVSASSADAYTRSVATAGPCVLRHHSRHSSAATAASSNRPRKCRQAARSASARAMDAGYRRATGRHSATHLSARWMAYCGKPDDRSSKARRSYRRVDRRRSRVRSSSNPPDISTPQSSTDAMVGRGRYALWTTAAVHAAAA